MPEKPYTRLGEPLSIHEIWKNGKIVALDDGSSWKIRWLDRSKAARWSPSEKVIVSQNDSKKRPYKLQNTFTEKIVKATIITFGRSGK